MPCYAPELTESVIDQYLHTDKPVGLIARDHAIDERDVTRIRHAAGLPPRRARTLAILTRTLHVLARLRGGATTQGLRHDDDIPADIDEFRRDLARRIDAFVAAETHRQDAQGDSRPAALDEAG